MKLFLDMDGVIADFIGGVSAAHNRPNPYLQESAKGVWATESLWHMPIDEFWKPTESAEFWANLPKTPEADEIVDMVEYYFGKENVALLTSPSEHPGCFIGKKQWVKKYYPQYLKKIIFANASTKEFFAPGNVLVDDKDSNVEEFIAAGGIGILVPRPWNKTKGLTNVIRVVDAGLSEAYTRRFK